jgi:phosphatidylinositol kinase/protein kinase (PI-3  family)
MRQDVFVFQVINLFLDIFRKDKVGVFLKSLNIVTNGRGGIIQTLTDTISLVKIKSFNDRIETLKHYFIVKYGKIYTDSYKQAIKNFLRSLVGYSLLCYFLEVKDRHNGNILLDDDGSIIHIDFGFILNHSPGNVNFEKVPFKLTMEYVDLLDGINSRHFKEFRELFYYGFVALRNNYQMILSFFEIYMFTNSDLPCFSAKESIINNLKGKFMLELSDDELIDYTNNLIDFSLDNWRTKVYDGYQNYCVGLT